MNTLTDLPPEADCADGAPHPRLATQILGQAAAEQGFLEAFNAQRLHHAWLLTGPPGIGKATLAWRIARFLLEQPAESSGGLFDAPPPDANSLDVDHETQRTRRITALSEPALFLLRRPWDPKKKSLSAQITVEATRGLKKFFAFRPADGGRRVVIVDCADELNINAANALLKMLEEPPEHTTFLLISHMPSRLLPTIRSRCRRLSCAVLSNPDVATILHSIDPEIDDKDTQALAEQSEGSVGAALRLHIHDGLSLRRDVSKVMATMPGMDRGLAFGLATSMAARGKENQRALLLSLVEEMLADLALAGSLSKQSARGKTDPALSQRLSPSPIAGRRWALAQSEVTARVRQGLAVNLDPQGLILDMLLKIDKVAAECAAS